MFEIHIFDGDPSRGLLHKGCMFSLHLSDGSYVKSHFGYPTPEKAACAAGRVGALLEKEITCRG